jgi:periplasmic protein TonB
MRAIEPTLIKALALSLLLHGFLLAACGWLLHEPVRRAVAAPEVQLDVTLRLQPRLFLEESTQPAARAPAREKPAREPSVHAGYGANAPRTAFAKDSGPALAGEAARQANAQMARELFYPPEAIARGLEGEVLVLLFLDETGNAIAARLEASSGHALLDDAAVRAARTLRALPDSAPREALLPVRFRLR